jgi:hypothetical protein
MTKLFTDDTPPVAAYPKSRDCGDKYKAEQSPDGPLSDHWYVALV